MPISDSQFAKIRNKALISEKKLSYFSEDGKKINTEFTASGISCSELLTDKINYSTYGETKVYNFKVVNLVNSSLVPGQDKYYNLGMKDAYDGYYFWKNLYVKNVVLSSDGGIDFGATDNPSNGSTSSSELLNDYEEGTWSPVLTGFTNASVGTSRYIKIGKLVTLLLTINSSGGNVDCNFESTIKGIPYPCQYFTGGYMSNNHSSNPSDYVIPLILSSNSYVSSPNTIYVKKDSAQSYNNSFFVTINYISTT